jgi:hypothetical protein
VPKWAKTRAGGYGQGTTTASAEFCVVALLRCDRFYPFVNPHVMAQRKSRRQWRKSPPAAPTLGSNFCVGESVLRQRPRMFELHILRHLRHFRYEFSHSSIASRGPTRTAHPACARFGYTKRDAHRIAPPFPWLSAMRASGRMAIMLV